ncbi:DUF3616 domain-containing protein [Bradyrhizobium ontarionense]|uniref:DUF3616 domain-containing protein n=1 Tax=Bradyrhizobium ontarionense TaxID=2898149 RepID=A0ABY3R699_9BRAD|nr:DUF3616 domain-containing protein [Bradyrhizobium sp. A19]UFZ02532.1 DUF3616 domain-containing protein [Bradyrhizobium sp. A19]
MIKLTPVDVSRDFEGKDGKTAADISGISCLSPKNGKRTCLLVNDQNREAQFATFNDRKDKFKVGETIKLIGKRPDPETLGQPPKPAEGGCQDDSFDDLDGEGVAYAGSYFYVVGSHGCSRKHGEFHLSSFILARVSLDSNDVTTTYRVSDLLKKSDKVAPFFAKNLDAKENGLNIEGIAAIDDTLWLGLRAPVTEDGDAYLVSGSISELFHAGHDQSVRSVNTVGIKLDGRGIRDLAPLPDGRILVLAGPAQDSDLSYKLYLVEPANNAKADLGTLEGLSQKVKGKMTAGKAEGLTVLDVADGTVRFVVVFDSLLNGAPHRGEVTLPKREPG